MRTLARRLLSGVIAIRNARTLGYPVEYVIEAIEPFCDELIVAEGYSEDGTYEDLLRLAEVFPKIRVIRVAWRAGKKGETIADVQNKAIEAATGRWILLIQADEFFPRETLRRARHLMETGAHDGVDFRFLHLRPDIFHQLRNPSYSYATRAFTSQGVLFRYSTVGDGYTAQKKFHFERLAPAFANPLIRKLGRRRIASIDDPPVFHVGYCVKARERIRSHAEFLYSEVPEYQELARVSDGWDGTASGFWDEVEEFKGEHPEALMRWWRSQSGGSGGPP